MIPHEQLILTEEYWTEIFENSLWRVKDGQCSSESEVKYLVQKVMELIHQP